MEDTIPSSDSERSALLSDPGLRSALVQALRKRVPESDVEDLAQAALTDALLARTAPTDALELRRWVHGILRNKVADFYRQRQREAPFDEGAPDAPEAPAESASEGARDLLRWAEKELPEGEEAPGTLDWMLREGDGEKLETIAREERVPAPRVRQRIARLRRYFRTRWAAQLAAIGVLSLLGFVVFLVVRRLPDRRKPVPIAEEPVPPRVDRGRELRRAALEECRQGKYRECLDGLDGAKRLDERGDGAEVVRAARSAATQALAPSAVPSASEAPSPAPLPTTTSSAAPVRTPPAPTDSFQPTPMPAPTESLVPAPGPDKPSPKNPAPSKAPFPRKPRVTNPSEVISEPSK